MAIVFIARIESYELVVPAFPPDNRPGIAITFDPHTVSRGFIQEVVVKMLKKKVKITIEEVD